MPGAHSPITTDTLLLLTSLHTLDISENHSISAATLRLIPNLTSLDLTGCHGLCLRELWRLENLRHLNLTQAHYGYPYRKLSNLEWLALPSLHPPKLKKLKHLTKLRTLRINSTERVTPSLKRIDTDAMTLLKERGGKASSIKSCSIRDL